MTPSDPKTPNTTDSETAVLAPAAPTTAAVTRARPATRLDVMELPAPRLIAAAGEHARRRFLEFFTVTIRNPNTRMAYARACTQFLDWCNERGFVLETIEPMVVAAYVEQLTSTRAPDGKAAPGGDPDAL